MPLQTYADKFEFETHLLILSRVGRAAIPGRVLHRIRPPRRPLIHHPDMRACNKVLNHRKRSAAVAKVNQDFGPTKNVESGALGPGKYLPTTQPILDNHPAEQLGNKLYPSISTKSISPFFLIAFLHYKKRGSIPLGILAA